MNATLIVAILSAVVAASALGVSLWQARINARRLQIVLEERDRSRLARLALTPVNVRRTEAGWEVELTIMNVGGGHARHIEIWLESEAGATVSERRRLEAPVPALATDRVTLEVARHNGEPRAVYVVRKYKDEAGTHEDPSEQLIELL
jgi:hypothetical protein